MQLSALSLAITRLGRVPAYSPLALFTGTATGVWYDPSDTNLTWRRNLLTYSEQFTNSAWNTRWGGSATIYANDSTFTAPDNTQTVTKVVATLGGSGVGQAITLTAGITYTFSAYVNVPTNDVKLQFSVSPAGGETLAATIITPSASLTRYSVTYTPATTQTYYVGVNDTVALQTFYIWGAQLEQGSTATSYQRITDGVQDYLSYQPRPVLYLDAAGTTPVTAVEQPVGLMLDKRKGLVLGPELVTNGDFSQGGTGWTNSSTGTGTFTVSSGAATIVGTDGSNRGSFSQNIGAVAGRFYKVSFNATITSGAGSFFGTGPGSGGGAIVNGLNTYYIAAGASGSFFVYTNSGGGNITLDNISVRELPGNHAFNSSGNSANFPVLSARYNLLTKTEQFDDAAWVKTNTTATATSITETTAGGTHVAVQSGLTYVAADYKLTAEIKPNGRTWVVLQARGIFSYFNLSGAGALGNTSGVIVDRSITALSDGYYRCSLTVTATAGADNVTFYLASANGTVSYTGDGTSGVLVRNIDLRVSNDALNQPAYQRVNTATDYDTVGFKPYLRFNGTNQWLQTNSIDFTYGDKMFVSAGVRKLSDADAIISELSQNFNSYNGSFYFASQPLGKFGTSSRGAATGNVAQEGYSSGYYAQVTAVLSALHDISDDLSVMRVNGVSGTNGTGDKGTGNFGNYPLYIGARAGSSLWFNGRLYQMVIAGKQASAAEITSTETYLNQKTGAF